MESKKETKEITAEYRMEQWAGIMRERAESGLSIVKYCAREGMPTNRYHYWQRRLRAAAVREIMKEEAETKVPAGWREVGIAERETAGDSGITIEIGKCRVGADTATDMELLRKVCKALTEIC